MSFSPGNAAIIKLDNSAGSLVDLTAYIASIDAIGQSRRMSDVTTFASTADEMYPTLPNAETYSMSGPWGTAIDSHMRGIVGGTASSTLEFYAAGTAAGKPKQSVEVYVTDFRYAADATGLLTYTASLQTTGALTYGTA